MGSQHNSVKVIIIINEAHHELIEKIEGSLYVYSFEYSYQTITNSQERVSL